MNRVVDMIVVGVDMVLAGMVVDIVAEVVDMDKKVVNRRVGVMALVVANMLIF
jgi:hypothetical protein